VFFLPIPVLYCQLMPLKMDLLRVYYLSQAGYVIVVVCLSVCLSVSNFAQKRLNRFARNAQGRLAMGR